MKRVCAIAIGMLGAAAPARAGGLYIGDQLGFSTVHGDAARAAFGDHAADLRVAVGARFGAIAIEAFAGGDLPIDDGVRFKNGLPGFGVDAKYVVPLARWGGDADGVLGAYGKLEARAGWLGDPSEHAGTSGGVGAGAGAIVSGTLWSRRGPLAPWGVRVGVWMERSADWMRVLPSESVRPLLSGPGGASASGAFDALVDHWTFGFGIGGNV